MENASFSIVFLVREVSLPCGAKPIRPVGSERRDFAIAFPPIARWNGLCRALPCLRSGNVVNPIRELLRFRCSMMHTLFCSKIKLQFPFISRAVSQPSDRLPRQQKKQSQLALPFCWCGRRDLNPYVGNTRPSNVRVCRFRHSREHWYYIIIRIKCQ